jgi:Clostridium epsilon toxin ETX/Bacillus mosquitocidal toxin MTX2
MVGRLNDFLQRINPDSPFRVESISGGVKCWGISTVLTDFNWTDVNINKVEDSVLYEQVYDNSRGSDTMTPTFTFSKSYQDSHTFTFTEGLQVGATTTIKTGLDFLAEGEVDVSVEVSFSAEQSFTYTDTKTWEMTVPVEVLPGTVANIKGSLNVLKQTARFNAEQRVTGGLAMIWVTTTLGIKESGIYPLTVLLPAEKRGFAIAGAVDSATGVRCKLVQTSQPEQAQAVSR